MEETRTLLELPLGGLCSWVRVECWRTLGALLVAIYQAWESHGFVLSCPIEWTSKSAQVCTVEQEEMPLYTKLH